MRVLVETRSECFPLNLELTDLAKPANQEALGILLLLSPGARITVHTNRPIFLVGCQVYELRSSFLNNKRCPHWVIFQVHAGLTLMRQDQLSVI